MIDTTDPRLAVVEFEIQSVCSDGNSNSWRVARNILKALDAHAAKARQENDARICAAKWEAEADTKPGD